jgi:hypothetical protein
LVYIFTVVHARELIKACLRNIFSMFPARFVLETWRVWSARDDHYTTEPCLVKHEFCRCGIFLFSFSVNKTPNAFFCPGSNWGPCSRKAHVMTVILHKQAHAYLLTYIKIYLKTLAIHNIFVKIQWVNFRMLWTLWKLPQYQTLEIDKKFIHLILQNKSIWILLVKQQKEEWREMWVTTVELVPVGYIFLV